MSPAGRMPTIYLLTYIRGVGKKRKKKERDPHRRSPVLRTPVAVGTIDPLLKPVFAREGGEKKKKRKKRRGKGEGEAHACRISAFFGI